MVSLLCLTYENVTCQSMTIVSFITEMLYVTHVTGLQPTIIGKRAQRECSDEVIDALMHPNRCCHCKTATEWKRALKNRARLVIKAERHVYGATTQEGRFQHYSPMIRTGLHMKTALASSGEGLIETG